MEEVFPSGDMAAMDTWAVVGEVFDLEAFEWQVLCALHQGRPRDGCDQDQSHKHNGQPVPTLCLRAASTTTEPLEGWRVASLSLEARLFR